MTLKQSATWKESTITLADNDPRLESLSHEVGSIFRLRKEIPKNSLDWHESLRQYVNTNQVMQITSIVITEQGELCYEVKKYNDKGDSIPWIVDESFLNEIYSRVDSSTELRIMDLE